MKLFKITFLFFITISLIECKNNYEKEISEKDFSNHYSDSILIESLNRKLSNKQRLLFSQKLLVSKNNLNDSIKSILFNNLSYLHYKLNNIDSAVFYSKRFIENTNKTKKIGSAYFKIGNYFKKKNSIDSAYNYLNKSKEVYIQNGDSINYGRVLLNIAIIESNYGQYSLSDSTVVEAIRYINGKRDKTTLSAYNSLAINAKKRFLYKEALLNYSKAIKLTTNSNYQKAIKNNIAIVYKEQKNYDKAIEILSNLLKDSIPSLRTKARVIDNLAHIKWLANPKQNILDELLLAKSIREQENYNYDLIASYSHLSDYFKENNKEKSLFYAYKMYEVAKQENATNGQLEAIDKIVELETPQKKIKYYKESIRLRDSLQKEETKRQYKFASIKYNYEEEEKQKLKFKNLATENELIAQKENNQKKNAIIVGVLSILTLLFLLYRRKQQQKKKVLEGQYLTETKIAKRLHDDLGNNIYNTLTKLQNSKIKREEIVNDLDKIYLQTRSISHENDAIETGENFENYFRELIDNYNTENCKIILKDFSILELNSLSKTKQIALYRVFNELLVNMKKHSNANLLVVSCKKESDIYQLIYKDNGVGFNNDNIVFKNGLKNMETRIKTINGTITFESEFNKGCKIVIRFKK